MVPAAAPGPIPAARSTAAARDLGGSLDLVRGLDIDPTYLRHVVVSLTAIGSSPLGFRTAGTPEDAAVAAFVRDEFATMGLADVAIEDVTVDAWRFRSASLLVGGRRIGGASFGGVPATPAGGVRGRLVNVGDGRRRRLDRLTLDGSIVILEWRTMTFDPPAGALELAHRGVAGIVLVCPEGGPWYQTPGAMGAFDGNWRADVPMMTMAWTDAATLASDDGGSGSAGDVTLIVDVELNRGAVGHNVVGHLPGDGEGPGPIVVGAHHDAWFRGAFDNTSGVAATLAIARALVLAGHRPRHPICFTTRTAEEFGIADSSYDWCIGAWEQVHTTHPEWGERSPFQLCVEATGRPGLRIIVETIPELTTWARRVARAAAAEGWLPTGWRSAPAITGVELWPLLVSGVPGVAAYAWEREFGRTDYHSQLDTIDGLDFGLLAAQARVYALMLAEADRDPDGILDHAARARALHQIAAAQGHDRLAAAAEQLGAVRGRAAFTPIGRGLLAVNAHGATAYPHAQAREDVRALTATLAALDAGSPVVRAGHAVESPVSQDGVPSVPLPARRVAARALRRVGSLQLHAFLSAETFRHHLGRDRPEATARSWGSASHLTPGPDLWEELASLLGEPGARPYGPWVRASLERALDVSSALLDERLDAMTVAVESAVERGRQAASGSPGPSAGGGARGESAVDVQSQPAAERGHSLAGGGAAVGSVGRAEGHSVGAQAFP